MFESLVKDAWDITKAHDGPDISDVKRGVIKRNLELESDHTRLLKTLLSLTLTLPLSDALLEIIVDEGPHYVGACLVVAKRRQSSQPFPHLAQVAEVEVLDGIDHGCGVVRPAALPDAMEFFASLPTRAREWMIDRFHVASAPIAHGDLGRDLAKSVVDGVSDLGWYVEEGALLGLERRVE